MNICIVGWYYKEPVYNMIKHLENVHCIQHRDAPKKHNGIEYHTHENIGLEFGAYDYYIRNVWSGDDTLFIHDDLDIDDIDFFDRVSKIKHDFAFIWNCENDRKLNCGGHGRGFFMSEKQIQWMLENGGFYYDPKNKGFIGGDTERGQSLRLDAGIRGLKSKIKKHNHYYDADFCPHRRGVDSKYYKKPNGWHNDNP